MKCVSHPAKDAITTCSVCKKPLCDLCAITLDDASSICNECAMLATLKEMGQRVEEKLVTKELKEEQKRTNRQSQVIARYLIIICIALVIAAAELFYYFEFSKPEAEEFIPSEDPATMTMIIDQAIQDYMKGNGGVLPFRLEDLRGKYLPADKVGPNDLANFIYIRTTPITYELRPKAFNTETRPIPEFIFTEEGIEFEQ